MDYRDEPGNDDKGMTASQRSLRELLLGDEPRFDIPMPPRNRYRSRRPVVFD
jgi:hypothetical protein